MRAVDAFLPQKLFESTKTKMACINTGHFLSIRTINVFNPLLRNSHNPHL